MITELGAIRDEVRTLRVELKLKLKLKIIVIDKYESELKHYRSVTFLQDLRSKARLEDLSAYPVEKVKPTAKGQARTYKYWYASWWEGDRAWNAYLRGAAKLSEGAALAKAKKMKAEALGLNP